MTTYTPSISVNCRIAPGGPYGDVERPASLSVMGRKFTLSCVNRVYAMHIPAVADVLVMMLRQTAKAQPEFEMRTDQVKVIHHTISGILACGSPNGLEVDAYSMEIYCKPNGVDIELYANNKYGSPYLGRFILTPLQAEMVAETLDIVLASARSGWTLG